MSEENLRKAKEELLLKKFKLRASISTSNMHLFDPKGVIKKYDNPEEILEEFFHLRLQLYGKRKKMLLANLELELLKLSNKVRFILGLVKGEIIVSNRKRADIFLELQQKGFTPFPKTKSIDALVVGATNDVQADYEYLLSMGIGTLTFEKIQELCSQQEKVSSEVDELRKSSPETLWMKDLDALDQKLDELDIEDDIAEADRKNLKGKVMNEAGMKASRPAAKNPRKNNTKKPTNPLVEEAAPVSSSMEMGEAVKSPPKGIGGARKLAPAKKMQKPTVVDEDNELLELKDRLAAYNLDSSPDQPAATKEAGKVSSRKIAPSERAAAQKQPTTTLIEISDDDDHNDEEFGVAPTGMKKGGRAEVVKPVAETRKRGQTKKQLLSQKQLITDVLKPVENAAAAGASSPEKKVRKIRHSPFNKKSGSSILGRMENKDDEISPMCIEEDSSASTIPEKGSSDEVVATRPRPVRATRRVAKYVGGESETELEQADDDDFEDKDEDYVIG